MATIYHPDEPAIRLLADVLRQGGLVAVPTETVYGLAADGTNAAACTRIFEVKRRPANDPLILHVHEMDQLHELARCGVLAESLAARFWPGPLTLVLDKRDTVPGVVTSGLSSVAIRMPSHPVMRQLLEACELPLAAPSANPFGYVSPTTAAHVAASLGDRIDHILDGGPCSVGVESTIVDLRDPGTPVLLRPGGVTVEDLEEAMGCRLRIPHGAADTDLKRPAVAIPPHPRLPHQTQAHDPVAQDLIPQSAPGQLSRHYSPRTRLLLHRQLSPAVVHALGADEAALFLVRPPIEPTPPNWRWLSEHGDLREAAGTLFARLRELDDGGYSTLHAEIAPESGLGRALNDRLRRAARQSGDPQCEDSVGTC